MLAAETLERIREVFTGKVCIQCGAPAERVSYGNKFWCGPCYRDDSKPYQIPTVRDPNLHRR